MVLLSPVLGCAFRLTADAPLILLSDLQQLHACSLDGVEDLQGAKKTRNMSPKHSSRITESWGGGGVILKKHHSCPIRGNFGQIRSGYNENGGRGSREAEKPRVGASGCDWLRPVL